MHKKLIIQQPGCAATAPLQFQIAPSVRPSVRRPSASSAVRPVRPVRPRTRTDLGRTGRTGRTADERTNSGRNSSAFFSSEWKPYPQAITTQPGTMVQAPPGSALMSLPPPMHGVPTGLEYLTYLDTVMMYQIKELFEIITDWDSKNKYVLKNANGEQCYYAFEESGCWERQCCAPNRGFLMHLVDNFNRIKTANNGAVVGAITKKWGGCCRETFTDADTFAVNFPGDLDVKLKGVLLGATFLIDFMEFEQKC
uniref:Phospholipid scramblase n=1 Tax=Caenorhabditis japonica TaxID=281687 RepID=A0A8R1DRL5_CAEJA